MVKTIAKVHILILESALGVAVGLVGLSQLVYGVPPFFFSDPETLRKFAASLITIGGTLVASGLFRCFFSLRVDATEVRILERLDGVTDSIGVTILRMLPAGVANRPSDRNMDYAHLYWRTQDTNSQPIWLRFSGLAWTKQILPFLEARSVISRAEFVDHHEYMLALVELRDCVVIVATRLSANEMAGVYNFAIPIVRGDQLYGCLRHTSMAKNECVSPCIFSKKELDMQALDQLWVNSDQGRKLIMNFPAGDVRAVAA